MQNVKNYFQTRAGHLSQRSHLAKSKFCERSSAWRPTNTWVKKILKISSKLVLCGKSLGNSGHGRETGVPRNLLYKTAKVARNKKVRKERQKLLTSGFTGEIRRVSLLYSPMLWKSLKSQAGPKESPSKSFQIYILVWGKLWKRSEINACFSCSDAQVCSNNIPSTNK